VPVILVIMAARASICTMASSVIVLPVGLDVCVMLMLMNVRLYKERTWDVKMEQLASTQLAASCNCNLILYNQLSST